jgi:uncharacterized membrane protein YfcA
VTDAVLLLLLLMAAMLYTSVGHAGASGYLAAMALVGLAPETMRPAALVLNVFVATLASVRYVCAGRFSWRLFWPLALAAAPMAFVGGAVQLPSPLFRALVGVALLLTAWRLWLTPKTSLLRTLPEEANRPLDEVHPPPLPVAILCGAAIGLVAGLTGTGGGIYLSPLIILCGWASVPTTSGVSVLFILVNSLAGLAGLATKEIVWPPLLPLWIVVVLVGGWIGSELGARRLATPKLRRLLAGVLVIAAMKLVLS